MKRIDVREHTKKHMDYAKKLGAKRYPITELGTRISMVTGVFAIFLGIFTFLYVNRIFGITLCIIGIVTGICNYVMYQNLKKK